MDEYADNGAYDDLCGMDWQYQCSVPVSHEDGGASDAWRLSKGIENWTEIA